MPANHHVLIVDGERFEVAISHLTGFQIRALVGLPDEYQLVVESKEGVDRILRDDQVISLENGPVLVFTTPPATQG